jgi:peptide/nickel transport system permease protein
MKKFLRKTGRKILSSLLTLWLVSIVCFGLVFLVPGDAAEQIALARYGVASANAAEVNEIRQREGLDKPVFVQYGIWFSKVMRGDFGRSLVSGKSVFEEISVRLPATIVLSVATVFFSILIALPLSVWAAIKHSKLRRMLIFGVSLGGAAIPSFWLAYLLMLIFAVGLQVLPLAGYGTFDRLILPVVSLGLGGSAVLLQLLSSALETSMKQDYIRTARAIGISETKLVIKYALKNAVLPAIGFVGVFFVQLLEGAVIIETIFAIPGLGRLLVNAVFDRDLPIIQGCVMILAVIVCLVNILTDFVVTVADPRIRRRSI